MVLTHLYTWTSLFYQTVRQSLFGSNTTKAEYYRSILQLLRKENILFTKVFQSITNNKSLELDPELRTELHRYTTNTSYEESEINHDCLDKIERDYNVHIDRRVINSGMIALVFKGTFLNDPEKPVIIKLKRANIDKRLKSGCDAILLLHSYFCYFFPSNTIARILKPFLYNIDDIVNQCDFGNEIRNFIQAKEDFAVLDYIRIPTIYNTQEDQVNTEFILMEHMDGTHYLPDSVTEADRLKYLEKFFLFTTYGLLSNSIQHSDLHSGNYIFQRDGTIAIIDYGMAYQFTDSLHDVVLTISSILNDKTPIEEIDIIDTFKDCFVPPLQLTGIENPDDVKAAMLLIVSPLFNKIDMDEFNILDSVAALSKTLKREFVLHHNIYKFLLSMAMMGSKVAIMGPYYKEGDPRMIEAELRALDRAMWILL